MSVSSEAKSNVRYFFHTHVKAELAKYLRTVSMAAEESVALGIRVIAEDRICPPEMWNHRIYPQDSFTEIG